MQEIAPGVAWVPTSFVNTYLIGEPGGNWAVVDSGLAGFSGKVIMEAEKRFGSRSRPVAVFLTHGHFDHAGNAQALADYWGVPIYAHRLEMPYLNGRSDYPPPDPTVGGAIAMLSRVMPYGTRDLDGRLRVLTPDATVRAGEPVGGEVPGMNGWRWVFTPGHSAGHVAYFRTADRVLLAGDAVATLDMDSYPELLLLHQQQISAAGSPFISDWEKYRQSVNELAELAPSVLACGHGTPMAGGEVASDLERFARTFTPPPRGRYVAEPAHTDERGVDWLPPKPSDLFPYLLGAMGLGLALGFALLPRSRPPGRRS